MKKIVIGTVALLFLLAGCGQKKESAEPSKDTTTEALQSTLPVLENANNNSIYFIRLLGLNELIYKVLRIVRNTVNSE